MERRHEAGLRGGRGEGGRRAFSAFPACLASFLAFFSFLASCRACAARRILSVPPPLCASASAHAPLAVSRGPRTARAALLLTRACHNHTAHRLHACCNRLYIRDRPIWRPVPVPKGTNGPYHDPQARPNWPHLRSSRKDDKGEAAGAWSPRLWLGGRNKT